MTDVSSDTAVILERLDTIDENISRLSTILTGNGNPAQGLVVRMTRIEDSVTACQDRHKEDKAGRGRFVMVAFAAVAGAVLSAIGWYIRGML